MRSVVGKLDGRGATVKNATLVRGRQVISWRLLAVLALAVMSMAHVGNPDTFFVGDAGPYRVRVITRLPGVIPGRGQVSVRVLGATTGSPPRVTVRAGQWNVGVDGAPPPETAVAVPGDPELFATELWFMTPSSYALYVNVVGASGTGSAIVPVMALATAQRTMDRGLGLLLGALGVLLTAGLVTIVGAAVRESNLAPGLTPDGKRRLRSWVAMGVTAAILGLAIVGGRLWWRFEATTYAQSVLYRPFNANATVHEQDGRLDLVLGIRDPRWRGEPNPLSRYNTLTPDHGKLMHLFLVREDASSAFAHLHPVPRTPASLDFDARLPPLPSGRYRVFADIVHESGYAQTLVAAADLPDHPAAAPDSTVDPDDSWFRGAASPESSEPAFRLSDGSSISWSRGDRPLAATHEETLTFSARDEQGAPLAIEPYMGMAAHVLIMRDDGSVFVHLHPAGTISMAALQRFSEQAATPPDGHAHHETPMESVVSIPFAFPKPGRYRIWVQMKHLGRIMTAAFDATVQPG